MRKLFTISFFTFALSLLPHLCSAQLTVTDTVLANVSCNGGSSGSAAAIVSGGSTPYTYSWAPSGGTGDTAIGLSAGTYTVTVIDFASNMAIDSVTITQPNVLTDSAIVTANVTCNGGSNGSDSANVSGGTMPYTYLWSDANSQTTATATGLSAGTYTLLVTDNNGCSAMVASTVNQPNPLAAAPHAITNVICATSSDGIASANPIGGTSPYTYLWSDASAQTTDTASGLSAGRYGVTITDSCGASVTDSVTIRGPRPITVTGHHISNVSCFGGDNGIASAFVRRGTPPYMYNWSPTGGTGDTASGLSAGTYTITVTDSCGSSATGTVIISQPAAITATTTSSPDSGGCTGSAGVTVSGGTAPYTYSWTGGGTNDTITGQCQGTYCCTITDAHGCVDSTCVTIIYTSIENITNLNNISVYPNPSGGQFMIQIGNGTVSMANDGLQVFNSLGEEIYPSYRMGPQFIVDLSSRPAGVYFIRIISNKGYLVGESKVVIQK